MIESKTGFEFKKKIKIISLTLYVCIHFFT